MFTHHGKKGMEILKQNIRSRNSKKTFTTSTAMTAEKKVTMSVTMSALHIQASKRMKKH